MTYRLSRLTWEQYEFIVICATSHILLPDQGHTEQYSSTCRYRYGESPFGSHLPMEPVGVALAVVPLFKTLGQLFALCRRFHGAPQELDDLESQSNLLSLQVQLISGLQEANSLTSGTDLPAVLTVACDRAVESVKRTVSYIEDEIRPNRKSGVRTKIHWTVIGHNKTKPLLDHLRRTEDSLNAVCQLLSQYVVSLPSNTITIA